MIWKPVFAGSLHGSSHVSTRTCTWPNAVVRDRGADQRRGSGRRTGSRRVRSPCRASPRTRRRTASSIRGPSRTPSRGSRSPTRAASGPRWRNAGRKKRPTRTLPAASSSRLSARYAAKKMTSSTLAISPGWKFSGPIAHPQTRAVDRAPDSGQQRQQEETHAEQRERVAVAARAGACCARRAASRRTRSRRSRPNPPGSRASSRSSREIVTNPMPFSAAASGSSVASAPGASRRTARCATT